LRSCLFFYKGEKNGYDYCGTALLGGTGTKLAGGGGNLSARVHADRDARGNCDYRDFGGAVDAVVAESASTGNIRQLYE
jgi:hypothetical protein